MARKEQVPAVEPIVQRPTSSLAEELRFLFLNTRDPRGRKWSLATVAVEAARYGEEMSRSHVALLLKGRVKNTTLRKVQVLGLVFGVGSMGLIHPLESQYGDEHEQQMATERTLHEIERHTGIVEEALKNAKLQRAVLLLNGYQSDETLEQAARIIEQIGEMEKHFLATEAKGTKGIKG